MNPLILSDEYQASPVNPTDLLLIYTTLQGEDLIDIIFCDGSIKTLKDLVHYWSEGQRDGTAHFYTVRRTSDNALMGFYYKNNYLGLGAMLHFSFFKAAKGYYEKIGGLVIKAELKRHTTIFGLTPFKHVARFAEKCGFKFLAELPGVCPLEDGRHANGYLCVAD